MRKAVSLLAILLLLASLGALSAAADGSSAMQIISCPEQGFSTMCDSGYIWNYTEKDGITIYTEKENSIPYVIVYCMEDLIVDSENLIREQYTPHMQKQYGSDLVAAQEFDAFPIGGRELSVGLYTYKLQGYLIDMLRAYENIGGHTVIFTAKYIDGKGEATRKVLDDVVQNYCPEADYYAAGNPNSRWLYSITKTDAGDTIYVFDEFFVTVPAAWEGKYEIQMNERSISFYQTLSRRLWNSRKGFEGGLLFSIGFSETTDYRDYLPSYDEIGPGSDGYYYLIYPTDYQAYADLETAKEEYNAMWAEIRFIAKNSMSFQLIPKIPSL